MSLAYREYPPPAVLAGHVSCFWTLEGESTWEAAPDRVIPDGCTELIWNLADRFRRYAGSGGARRQEATLVVGQITRPIYLAPGRRISLVAVRFRPAALGAFLGGVHAAELTDLDLPLEDVVGHRLREVGDRLASAYSVERVHLLGEALTADLSRAAPVDPAVAAAVDWIAATGGRIRMGEVAGRVGLSRRHLERRFLAAVGLTPKRLARIVRFRSLLARLDEGDPSGWSGLATACGYYDQPHLIRDFRELADCTPGEYLSMDLHLGRLFLGEG